MDAQRTWVFGAPEMVVTENSPAHKAALAQASELAERGLRTLVLAVSSARISGEDLPTGLEPVLLVTLREKVRRDAPETIAYFLEQGWRASRTLLM